LRVNEPYYNGCVALRIPVGGQTSWGVCGGNENGTLIRS
jgi:hypothetical protein